MQCCEQQRERATQPSEEPQRGVNGLDGKVKRNHLNTPRYEYSDVYTHGDKTRSTQTDPSEWRLEMCVCRKQGGVQWLVSCDLSNVMHRDSAVEGGAIKHEKGGS